jgi:hypothetical protein
MAIWNILWPYGTVGVFFIFSLVLVYCKKNLAPLFEGKKLAVATGAVCFVFYVCTYICVYLVHFPSFGILRQEISGNPA